MQPQQLQQPAKLRQHQHRLEDAEQEQIRRDLFSVMRNTMRTAAMVPLQLELLLPPQMVYGSCVRGMLWLLELAVELFLYFVTIHIWLLYLYTLYFNWDKDDLEFVVNCLIQAIIYFWTIVMKLYFRRLQPQRLRRLIDYINLRHQARSASGFTYVTMAECLAFSNKTGKIYVYCCFLGTIFWLILPLASGDRTLPLSCWYPFDYKKPLVYEAMYALQSIGQLEVAAAFSASSGLHMALAILISAGAPRKLLEELQSLQESSDAEISQYYCAKEHNVDLDDVRLVETADWQATQNIVPRLKASLRACVSQHRFVMGALIQMEAFYSPIWFFKTGEVIFLMCLVAFVSVKSTTTNSSLLQAMSLAQYLLLVAWEMLIICYFGEVILENSRRCGEALWRSPWYMHMYEMRNDFVFFVMNAQRVFRLTAGKIYVLNVERFRGIVTTAFSFLTLLQKMDVRS